MSDDFAVGIPIDDAVTGDADFDPNAVESDDFLDDAADVAIPDLDTPLDLLDDEEDDDLLDE